MKQTVFLLGLSWAPKVLWQALLLKCNTLKWKVLKILLATNLVLLVACGETNTPPKQTLDPILTRSMAAPTVNSTPRVIRLAMATPNPAQNSAERDDKEDPSNPANMTMTQTNEILDALPKVGSPAPDFTLRALDGTTVTLSALRGHPVLINFWATWCVACREEAPELEAALRTFGPRGLVILGVDDFSYDKLPDVQAYVEKYQLSFNILLDDGQAFNAYRVPGLPTSFFVDKRGVIRQLIMGQMTQRDIRESLELMKTW